MAMTAKEIAANKATSQQAAMSSLNNATLSPWIGGIMFGAYTDVYNADGSLKTFNNKAGDKISGRVVVGADGREVKLYNAFLNLALGSQVVGVSVEQVPNADGAGTFPFVSVKGASFGVFAVQSEVDTDQVNEASGKPYKRIDHSLQKTTKDKKPAPATV